MVNYRPSTARGPFRVQAILGAALLLCVAAGVGVVAQTKRDFNVSAKKFRFTVSGTDAQEIRVSQDDLVRITLSSEDIPHSFTLPDYRIQKRVEPGREVIFEFRAEKVGRFEFYCSMTSDGCRERGMVGALIVVAR
ncbi:MAG: cupredoxin domain-containing protein [Acidobacteria bacterium]|jgi:heme/copper-type cytochrome/quinol oxidase subunit 2|nr:cupredoxin domain-containing protein [Acidobacteriota bacterium]